MTDSKINGKKDADVRRITRDLLRVLDMNVKQFSEATGLPYMRVYNLWRGRTLRFTAEVVNTICDKFPHVNKQYLYSGEGLPLDTMKKQEFVAAVHPTDATSIMSKVLDLQMQNNEREAELARRERELMQREFELNQREQELKRREQELGFFKPEPQCKTV